MHRFFLTESHIHPSQAVDLTPLVHQLTKVLRLQPGTEIILLDNRGNEFTVRITVLQKNYARGEILTAYPNRAEPQCALTLYQCSLKADKFEWILQKGTELGVTTFVPVISQRSIVRPAAAITKKYDRWQAIIREAAEQCGRGKLPILAEPLDWADAIIQAQGARWMPWESAPTDAPLLHTVAQSFAGATFGSQAADNTPAQVYQQVAIIIGPEGGIATDEAAAAQEHGWQCVSLGPRILRAETAALAAVTMIIAASEPAHPMT